MKYLLDVSLLIAYGFRKHGCHDRASAWILSRKDDCFCTCSITELGFVRILGNVRAYGMDVAHARVLLMELKAWRSLPLVFIPDENDISFLPTWAKSPSQTTDAHLLQLAKTNGAMLATLDERIPGAWLIP
jgi:predicted nucleic acid-binding protein